MMLKVKPEYLSKRGRREFVVLTVEDFDRMREAIEDAQDLRALREATRRNAKAPYYTAPEVDRRLRTRSMRKKRAAEMNRGRICNEEHPMKCWYRQAALCILLVLTSAAPATRPEYQPTADYTRKTIRGWTVLGSND